MKLRVTFECTIYEPKFPSQNSFIVYLMKAIHRTNLIRNVDVKKVERL